LEGVDIDGRIILKRIDECGAASSGSGYGNMGDF
jgi:hypothetical protein